MLRVAVGFIVATVAGGVLTAVSLSAMMPRPPVAATADVDTSALSLSAAAAVDTTPHNLPQWVQTRRVAALWSGPDDRALQFTTLPAWTCLKVDGAQNDRLHVEYSGDGNARKAGPGWVPVNDVQPSDASGARVRNQRASQLYSDSAGSTLVAAVPRSSWIVTMGDQSSGRVHVRVYAASFTRVLGEGWLPAANVGPTDAPVQSVWTAADSKPPANEFASHEDFISKMAAAAQTFGADRVPVSVTVAQAILESNWGDSLLSREARNYFGIKATGQIGNDGAVWMRTLEYVEGGAYNVLAPFRAYKSLSDSVADHSQLFVTLARYRPALESAGDPDEFARRIASAGYSTDPTYAWKLIDLMHRYHLYRFDGLDGPRRSTALQA